MSAERMGGGSVERPCRKLRSKQMFIDAAPDPSVPDTRDGFFWCTHTMNCLGPDGALADPERCRPGRVCHEPY